MLLDFNSPEYLLERDYKRKFNEKIPERQSYYSHYTGVSSVKNTHESIDYDIKFEQDDKISGNAFLKDKIYISLLDLIEKYRDKFGKLPPRRLNFFKMRNQIKLLQNSLETGQELDISIDFLRSHIKQD